MFDMIVRNGVLVNADGLINADIAIKDGKISNIGLSKTFKKSKLEIDAKGKYILPGLIDPHIHSSHPVMNTVSVGDFFSNTVAAAFGGNTTVIDFAIQWNKETNIFDVIKERRKQADPEVVIDYSFHVVPTKFDNHLLRAIPKIIKNGMPSFKFYMIYREQGRMVDDAMIFEILKEVKKQKGIIAVHAENAPIAEMNVKKFIEQGLTTPEYFPKSKPNIVEAEAINRATYLNQWAESRLYIVHLSTAEGLELIKNNKNKPGTVFTETCPQYLTLDEKNYKDEEGYKFICSPPLRTQKDIDALWKGIEDGTVEVIGSDHCGFSKEQKALNPENFNKTPNGLPGIELRLPIIYTEGVLTNRISISRMVELLSTNPAKIYGLYPRKGALLPGSDADLVIIDVEEEKTITAEKLHGPINWSPYEGKALKCFPDTVISNGKIIMENDKFKGKRGDGVFLKRKISG